MSDATYQQLLTHVRELGAARSIEMLLDWDQETYMPTAPAAAAARGNHLSLIAGVFHERLTSSGLEQLLTRLEHNGTLADPLVATNVRETRREHDRAVKLPKALVEEIARTCTVAKNAWLGARKESSFKKFAPHLQKLVDLKRQVADRVGYQGEPYDALLDEFEPGATASQVQAVFEGLRRELVPLAARLQKAPRQPDLSVLRRACPVQAQAEFGAFLAAAVGFDFERGRIDVAPHPFCSGFSPSDVRLTTRYAVDYLPQSIFGTLHEAGHGMYEQGLRSEHEGTPCGRSVSLGIHESQSRMWENQVGRSRVFWESFFPQLQRHFPSMHDVSLDAWVFAVNAVSASLIRVEADEVTYGLHIMLRFDLERRLISGALAVADVPSAWNAGMQILLGITPPDDARGCLQDIHWSSGIFGYFPTYLLGNLYAAQFHAAARKALPDLDARMRKGDFATLLDWLRTNIHQHGMRYRAAELVQHVTGAPLSPQHFVTYLKEKYLPLYGL